MKTLKVYLQYPWKFPDSPYYKYLIDSPPEGVNYLNTRAKKGVITNKKLFFLSNFIKNKIIRGTFNKINFGIPNAHLSPSKDYDLIHCAHSLSKNLNKPWVADIEMMGSLTLGKKTDFRKNEKILKILKNKNCKKILPWTKLAKDHLIKIYPEISNKIQLLYPAVPEIKNLKKKKNEKLKIIFIARYFKIKGGEIALEVLKRLEKKYKIEGIVVASVPQELKKKYPSIKIFDLMPQKELFSLMESSDIFLYPSVVDSFGFSILESMSFGLPTVSINTNYTQSREEIIEHGKNGLIFNLSEKVEYNKIEKTYREAIELVYKGCCQLIEKPELLKKMSQECIKNIQNGKFSLLERNKKLKKVYKDALNEN